MVIDVEVSVSGSSNLVTDSTCTLIHETLTNITYIMRKVLRGKKIKLIHAYEWPPTTLKSTTKFQPHSCTERITMAPVAIWGSLYHWGLPWLLGAPLVLGGRLHLLKNDPRLSWCSLGPQGLCWSSGLSYFHISYQNSEICWWKMPIDYLQSHSSRPKICQICPFFFLNTVSIFCLLILEFWRPMKFT